MAERVWVWHESDETVQHLATQPDDVTMAWDGETACGRDGAIRRVTWENVDNAKACDACTDEDFSLAGGDRGPP
ncbi:MAG: hypothetical protein ACR2MA_08615 [Egibacteraceae bacterium]